MTALVTGGAGQLATSLAAVMPAHRVGRPDFDFDRPDDIPALLDRLSPTLIINAAAYTAVDAAESDPDAAARANHTGPALLAQWCAANDVPLIHVSTDYVFDGVKGAPYLETDPTSPTGVYGTTKRDGEQAVLATGARAIILRTSWVYSATGKNFVRTMLNAGARNPTLRVVADQIGCPTSADDLAAAIAAIAARLPEWRSEFGGIFHAAGTGWTSWHGLATTVFELGRPLGAPQPEVAAIATADWPTPARRPADSRLDGAKLHDVFGLRLPEWQDGLRRVLDRLLPAA